MTNISKEFECILHGSIHAVKETISGNFLLQVFHESSSPKPLKISLGSFRFFRYSQVKVPPLGHWVIPLGTLGNSSTDFDLKTHIHPQRPPCKPASTLLASSLQYPSSNNVLRLFLSHVQRNIINQKRVACRHQTFSINTMCVVELFLTNPEMKNWLAKLLLFPIRSDFEARPRQN
jgi:hypothetical protein